jgi:hypothetical protein
MIRHGRINKVLIISLFLIKGYLMDDDINEKNSWKTLLPLPL